jgi:polyhydroxyalkanoate synthesis regulator phasin
MLDTVRRYVEAGREALTPKKAEELARALVQQGQARADQAGRIARDLVEWSRKSSERLREAIGQEVKKQMSKAGVATKDEIESLKRRIRELESQAKTATGRRTTTQRSAGAKKTRARPTTGTKKSQTSGATRVPRAGTARRTPPAGTRGG